MRARAAKHVGNLAGDARTGNSPSLREWLHDSQMDLHDIHIGSLPAPLACKNVHGQNNSI